MTKNNLEEKMSKVKIAVTMCIAMFFAVLVTTLVTSFISGTKTDEKQIEIRLFADIEGTERVVSTFVKKTSEEPAELFIGNEDNSFVYGEYTDEEGFFVQEFKKNGEVIVSIKKRNVE
jgi:hypothetical protein